MSGIIVYNGGIVTMEIVYITLAIIYIHAYILLLLLLLLIIIIIRVHHAQRYTTAILPPCSTGSFITKLHCSNKNQVW